MAQTYAGTNTSSGVRLTTSELAQTSIEARKRWDPNRAAATWPDGPRVQMPSTQEVQLRREAQQGRYTYTQAAQTQPDPAPYEYEQPETLGLYTQELERLKTQLTQAEADMNAAKERSQAADGLVNGTALSGGMVSAESIANANAAREEYQQAQQLYSSLLAQQHAYEQAMGTNAARGSNSRMSGVYDNADNRLSSLYSEDYADILNREDYAQLSQAGDSKLRWFSAANDGLYDYINDINGRREKLDYAISRGVGGKDYSKYAFMTADEIGVYNYLYATEGKDAANQFLEKLEPELDKQWYSGASRNTTEWVNQNGWTKAAGSAATVLAQPARTISSAAALIDDTIRTAQGKEINPYSDLRQISLMTNDVRSSVAEDMSGLGSFVYQTAMSALDSTMNAVMAGGIAEGIGLTGNALSQATNIIGSTLMSSEVASLAVAESKEKGYSDGAALLLGLTRGAIEYASEAIGGDWVIKNVKENPASFLRTLLLNFIPEGMEEVMSDAGNEAVNTVIDWLFGTEESYIGQTYRYFRDNGTDEQKENPIGWTLWEIVKQEGLSFLGGGFATIGSSSVQFRNNQKSLNNSAQALGTSRDTVVQLMNEMGTDDPAAVGKLAEITGAEDVEGFRDKLGQMKDAGVDIDEVVKKGALPTEQGAAADKTNNSAVQDVSQITGETRAAAIDDEIRRNAETEARRRNAEPGGNQRMEADDIAQWQKTGTEGHIIHAKEKGGDSLVLTSDAEIKSFIRDTINHRTGENQQSRVFGVVGSRMAEEIKSISGGRENVDGWYLELSPSYIQHSYDGHLSPKQDGNIALSMDDYENIANYIDSYDDLFYKEFKNGEREIIIGRKIDGYTVIIEMISNKRQALGFRNMWGLTTQEYEAKYKQKKNPAVAGGRSSVSANDPTSSRVQDSSANSIRASTQNSNKNLSGNTSAEVPADAQIRGNEKPYEYGRRLYQAYLESHGLLSQETDAQTDDSVSFDAYPDRLNTITANTAWYIQQALGTEAAIDYVAEQFVAGRISSDEAYQIWRELRERDGA